MNVGESLKRHWLQQNVPKDQLLRGASEAEITAFEACHNVRLPDDLRQYFLTVNGIGGSKGAEMDGDLFSFWPISAVKSVADYYVNAPHFEESDPASLFIFADYCIECHYYAIQLNPDSEQPTPVYLTTETPKYQFGNSFADFIELYLANPDFLINPWREQKPLK